MEEREYPRIMPGVEVFDADGDKVGSVAHVYEREMGAVAGATPTPVTGAAVPSESAIPRDGAFEVKTGFFGLGKHYYIPFSAIKEVTTGGIFLTAIKADFDARGWQTKPDFVAHPEVADRAVSPERQTEVVQPQATSTAATATTAATGGTDAADGGPSAASPTGWNAVASHYQTRWTEHYGTRGAAWETYEPRYRFAWERAQVPENRDRSWISVQPELRAQWETLHPDQEWETVADTIRDAWEHPAVTAASPIAPPA